ncbi:E3 ubiquitin-protein ligase TRIM39-like [Gopherus evgoodei]|uniref:E3 ubiquitin-protein ligase TRIM39-like n=1 Tax=Gopherus evgoodei TaxID=1825980 RepID=A0A8C4WTX1_9SAUR|nr:E3 ubiquitin-protein ligase TRIM39-like [Gopherus evgoodei]
MATESSGVETLQRELACSICLEYFQDPVSIQCGHNFCRACITKCWEGSVRNFSCPQCRKTARKRNFRPNRELASVIEIAKGLSLQAAKGLGRCEKHQEALKLFCEEDQTRICLVCRESQAHRAHTVVPIEEAGLDYKEQIQTHLRTLKEDREKLLGFKKSEEGRCQQHLKQTQAERQKIGSLFQQLHQMLEEKERLLLVRLKELDKTIVRLQNENVTKLSKEISHLSEQISEMERKCQQAATEFPQGVRSTLSRCKKGKSQQQVEIPLELEEFLSEFSQGNSVRKTLKESKVNVTLDPDTADPELTVSEDRKSVRWGDTQRKVADNPKRFDTQPCVLGCEGFTSGRHYWEVEVGDGGCWAVGVARESVRWKEEISHNPEGGIWILSQCVGEYWAQTSPLTTLYLSWDPRRIGLLLDYDMGRVSFFDADNEKPIFTFPPASFGGERVRPWFRLCGEDMLLQLCP